ncbi:MAG: S41 family peptidase [Chloroflexota bacterium]
MKAWSMRLWIIGILILTVACGPAQPPPNYTPEADEVEAIAEEASETAVPTIAPTNTPAPTETPLPTNTPAPTATPEPTATMEPTATVEPTAVPETENSSDSNADLYPHIQNDEGGPVVISGEVNYTSPFFTTGVAEPIIILEDQAGFVDRDESFILPPESQTLGQITSDFFESPFSYSLSLPVEPQGSLRDVDNDSDSDIGVQIFAIAYWTNTFGDPFLERRDLGGGGWSTAYASTLVSSDPEKRREIVGGSFLIYAPDAEQSFPSEFGEDGLLFTGDESVVPLPAGYTMVYLDSEPFVFDRAAEQVVDLIEPDGAALVDLSEESYTDAFQALVDKLSKEYAFTELKGIDWEELRQTFTPRFEVADADSDSLAYRRALRDFAWQIPDGHVSGPVVREDFQTAVSGGIGISIRKLDDGRVIVSFLVENSPAAEAGLVLGTEITAINAVPIDEAIANTIAYSAPFSTDHVRELQQLRYVTRAPLGETITLTYRNPSSSATESVTLDTVNEVTSFNTSSLSAGRTGTELPVEYEILPSGYGYAQIFSFSDNELLSIQLWERMIRTFQESNSRGVIIDMRQNGGGSGFLADQMAAYFFQEELTLGNSGFYLEEVDDFFFDERNQQQFFLPPEELRYNGKVAVLVGPNCNSACEFFSFDMSLEERSAIIGHYPTGGLGGSIDRVLMPEGEFFTFTQGRAVDPDGNIHIEGQGVAPTIQVPVTEEALFSEGDPVLEAAIAYLDEATAIQTHPATSIAIGETLEDSAEPQFRDLFDLVVRAGDVIDIVVSSDDFDPILRIYDTDGNLLILNDNIDSSGSDAGFIGLEIPVNLTLVLEIGSVDDNSTGEYTLTVQESE